MFGEVELWTGVGRAINLREIIDGVKRDGEIKAHIERGEDIDDLIYHAYNDEGMYIKLIHLEGDDYLVKKDKGDII